MSDIAERVKKIVVEHLGVEPEKVVEGANFIDDLGADSLDTVELVMAFEEEVQRRDPRRCRRDHSDGRRRREVPREELRLSARGKRRIDKRGSIAPRAVWNDDDGTGSG